MHQFLTILTYYRLIERRTLKYQNVCIPLLWPKNIIVFALVGRSKLSKLKITWVNKLLFSFSYVCKTIIIICLNINSCDFSTLNG